MLARNNQHLKSISSGSMTIIKRSVGYDDEEDEDIQEARKRCRRMNIDGDTPACMGFSYPTP